MKTLTRCVGLLLTALLLAGCTTTYTMTTRTGQVIETQGKPVVDTTSGLTKYADAYGYHREIRSSEITQISQGGTHLSL